VSISPEMLRGYTETARARVQAREKARVERYRRAWQLALDAARLLKEEFGAAKVAVFGSLVHEDQFTPWSDIDLAVWGLEGVDFFAAVAHLQDMNPEIEVDLIAIPYCQPSLLQRIQEEGIPV